MRSSAAGSRCRSQARCARSALSSSAAAGRCRKSRAEITRSGPMPALWSPASGPSSIQSRGQWVREAGTGGMSERVSFHRMDEGTREDYELLDRRERQQAQHLPESILNALMKLDDSLECLPVSRLEHSL